MSLSDFFYMGGYAAFLWPAHQEARRAAARRLQMEETRS